MLSQTGYVAYNVGMQIALLVLTLTIVFALLVANEFWWRKQSIHSEFSRKFIHITVGSFVAFWPFFLSWNQIKLLSVAFLVVIVISKYLKIFQAIHSVQRPTLGEVFFAASVGIIACITTDKWIYAAALLQMSLADGLAAILGIKYGGRQRYLVFRATKSVVGTLTFFVVSVLILVGFNMYGDVSLTIGAIIGISMLASLIENIAVRGSDNLLVPVLVALILAYY